VFHRANVAVDPTTPDQGFYLGLNTTVCAPRAWGANLQTSGILASYARHCDVEGDFGKNHNYILCADSESDAGCCA